MSDLKVKLLGFLSAVFAVGSAIGLSFYVALSLFWWCPDGGCSLAGWTNKFYALANVFGVIFLMLFFSLSLLFLFVLLARPFVDRPTIEAMLFQVELPLLGWYDKVMHRWVNVLWGRHAA